MSPQLNYFFTHANVMLFLKYFLDYINFCNLLLNPNPTFPMKTTFKISVLASLLYFSTNLFAQTIITGSVVDSNNDPLFEANILVEGSSKGTTANEQGQFTLSISDEYPINLTVSFIGFNSKTIHVFDNQPITISLEEGNVFDEVIVSASRKVEKLQEAPAAVSIISGQKMSESGGSISPIRALINTPGVELQQQTGQRINIALRGSSGVFSTNVFPMLDYRSLISPGLEYFDSQNSPINNIDLERVEVVLGPASALYGPDVTTGVIHFISKNPFEHSGSTAEMIYGERNTFKIAFRHGGKNKKETFGYKFNLRYGSGKDFTLNPSDPNDQNILSNFKTSINRAVISEGYVDTDSDGIQLFDIKQEQIPDYWAAAANTSLYFRPREGMEIVTAGGWNSGSALFYNDLGEGQVFSNEYWGQARFNYKGWFAQTYFIKNDGGNDQNPTYLNRTGLIVPLERSHYEAQLQYNFNFHEFLNSEWTLGVDYRDAKSHTQNHVYGRNENNDDYTLYGGYTQIKMKPHSKLDLFLAGRYDGYNFTNEKTFSPRAAVVYKPNTKHNLRLTYNKSANPIPASDIYFDLPTQSERGILDVWVLGASKPYTYRSNPDIDWLIPGVPNTPLNAGFPLQAAFASVNPLVIQEFDALSENPQLAPLLPLLTSVLQSANPSGFAPSITTDIDGNPLNPVNRNSNLISFLNAYEFGYKGLFGNRLAAGFDVYYLTRKGGAAFQQVNPIVTISNLDTLLGDELQSIAQPQLEQGLIGAGLDEATAAFIAGLLGQEINGAYKLAGAAFIEELSTAGLPFHGVVPLENSPQGDAAKLIFGYYNINTEKISRDWGFEVHSKYYLTNEVTTFVNYTWFNRKSGAPGELNFPQNKIRAGISYQPETKFNASMNYQWDQAYTSNLASYPGRIDAKSLVDLSLGYSFTKQLNFQLSATNLFNNEFRALPGFPRIGRTIIGRFVVDF
jgi:iron complex outermembrane receptor protein